MKTKMIILKEKFSHIISTRVAVENLFKFNAKSFTEIIIDFNEINFISSSAAHQVVIEMKTLKDLEVEVNIINVNDDVLRMINLAKTDRKNIFTTQKVSVCNALNKSDLAHIFQ
jgi:anti-anti-sigma factor